MFDDFYIVNMSDAYIRIVINRLTAVARDLWSINCPSPRAKAVYGHKSLATAVYLLYS